MVSPGKAILAYEALERMIVLRELAPGSLVSEYELMELTGLGRTPVREALQRLARHRMVEIHPRKGVLVPAISVEVELRLLEVRRIVEALAVRLACARARPDQMASVSELASRLVVGGLSLTEYAERVRQIQDLITRCSENDFLQYAIAPTQGLSRRFWLANVIDEAAEVHAASELQVAILDAILARDAVAAEAASCRLNDYLVEFAHRTLSAR